MRLLAALILLSFFSCKREKEKYVIKGILYKDCNHTIPYANYPLLLEYFTKSRFEDPFLINMNTNEKGEFSATYESVSDLINGKLTVSLFSGYSYNSLVSNLPLNKNVYLGNIVNGEQTFYVVKIATPKSYTDNDTLYYATNGSNFAPPYRLSAPYVIGPFRDGQIIDTLTSSNLIGYNSQTQSLEITVFNDWHLGSRYYDPKRKNETPTKIKPCAQYSEVLIDLNQAVK